MSIYYPQTLEWVEETRIYAAELTLDSLKFVGKDKFTIEQGDDNYDVYIVRVYRSRLETDEEVEERLKHSS